MWQVWVTVKIRAGFGWGNLRERDHLEQLAEMDDNINIHFKEVGSHGVD